MAHRIVGKKRNSNIAIRAKQYIVKVSDGQTSRGNQEERWAGMVKDVFADEESWRLGFEEWAIFSWKNKEKKRISNKLGKIGGQSLWDPPSFPFFHHRSLPHLLQDAT